MDRKAIIARVRAYTRDLSASIFRTVDVVDFVNEGSDRLKGRINQLAAIPTLTSDDQTPTPLPDAYHHLLAVYAASRCFSQDERHYQASTLMNEFETKLEELFSYVNDGSIIILDPTTKLPIASTFVPEYVKATYFTSNPADFDKGVLGVK